MDRREFIRRCGILTGSTLLPILPGCGGSDSTDMPPDDTPVRFLHGVASGDPLADRVILWTRVTPDADGPVNVRYRVATDPAMTQVLLDERVVTDADRDYTVKVDPVGLNPGTTYYYRFSAGGAESPIGREAVVVGLSLIHI